MKTYTTIKIQKSTTKKLRELGKKGETYDTILNNLIEFYKKRKVI